MWTAPFSLDVTDVDADIWYSVLIFNVTDETTAVSCTNCTNITETFTLDYPSPCHKYNFTIVPLNGAGEGPSSAIVVNFNNSEAVTVRNICKHVAGHSNLVLISSLRYLSIRGQSYYFQD